MAGNLVSIKFEIIAPTWLLVTAGVLLAAGKYLPPLKWIGSLILRASIRASA